MSGCFFLKHGVHYKYPYVECNWLYLAQICIVTAMTPCTKFVLRMLLQPIATMTAAIKCTVLYCYATFTQHIQSSKTASCHTFVWQTKRQCYLHQLVDRSL